jgi:hypothetical protein
MAMIVFVCLRVMILARQIAVVSSVRVDIILKKLTPS